MYHPIKVIGVRPLISNLEDMYMMAPTCAKTNNVGTWILGFLSTKTHHGVYPALTLHTIEELASAAR
jgi:hypothetical protein